MPFVVRGGGGRSCSSAPTNGSRIFEASTTAGQNFWRINGAKMSRTTRRDFIRAVGLSAGAMAARRTCGEVSGERKRPNIILMVADDLGYGDLGCYDCPDIRTPNIDRLAREGVRFTDAYAAAPVCSPTRVALVTGRYQQRVGYYAEDYMGGGSPELSPDAHPTIGTYLKQAGYRTACYGKWNIGGAKNITPNEHGFDHWIGLHHNFNYFTHRSLANPEGPSELFEDGERVEREGYITDILADCAVDFIRKHAGDAEPFFLYLPWQAPHAPMQAPDDDPASSPQRSTDPENRPFYVKIVERLDYQVGRIMQALREAGADEQTLVVFTSDNGGHRCSRNLPLKGGKQELDEGGIRVPLIVRYPGTIPARQITGQMAITLDLTATAVALAGAAVSQEHALDGIDLMPYVTGERRPDPNRTLCWRRLTTDCRAWTAKLRTKAIREGDWKYVYDGLRGKEHLYNLRDDIGETRDLVGERPDLATRLRAKLGDWEKEVTPTSQPLFEKGDRISVAGHLTAVSPTSITVRLQIGGDDLKLTVVGDPSVKSVVVKELSDIPDGTYVTVEGPLSDDNSRIAARRITVPVWIKRADGRIGADSASGTLTVTGEQATLKVGNTQIAVATSGPPKPYVTFQDRLSVGDLEVGDKVLVNGKKVGDTSILSGVFVYPDSR